MISGTALALLTASVAGAVASLNAYKSEQRIAPEYQRGIERYLRKLVQSVIAHETANPPTATPLRDTLRELIRDSGLQLAMGDFGPRGYRTATILFSCSATSAVIGLLLGLVEYAGLVDRLWSVFAQLTGLGEFVGGAYFLIRTLVLHVRLTRFLPER